MIIDAHTHIWPDSVARKALAGSVPDLERRGDGTQDGLKKSMAAAGVDRSVCLAVANNGAAVDKANRFSASLDPGHFLGFGSVHPDLTPEENLASLRRHGLRGVKIHPFFQRYALDDERLAPLLDAMQGEFAVIIHIGSISTTNSEGICSPGMLADLVRNFPRLDVIACHFGGYRQFEAAAEIVIGLPVYVDTSWPPSLAELDPGEVRKIIHKHGTERVVFASDWPMADQAREIRAVRELGLADDDVDQILGLNLARLLGLSS
ncbi:amidohydrolase [Nocardia sp. 852002-20019_SCH5090214]|uniref:amidohydrolase family protein n=1 Tax=Nocardia sp. 852002-20019_SCH5090214 TaxID=1834087 RepID=UPI0007EA015E|nr:amidohydrolase family protein [Nocardia sp. 852002-20019_SCH5090214]OBA54313.1 amidohydrolase [Nocardia sp. 852002-20019_SCH5090214]